MRASIALRLPVPSAPAPEAPVLFAVILILADVILFAATLLRKRFAALPLCIFLMMDLIVSIDCKLSISVSYFPGDITFDHQGAFAKKRMTTILSLKALHICVIVASLAYRCYVNSAPLDPYVASVLGTSSAVAVRASLSFQPGGSLLASDPRTVVELIGAATVHVPRVHVILQAIYVLLASHLLHRTCLVS